MVWIYHLFSLDEGKQDDEMELRGRGALRGALGSSEPQPHTRTQCSHLSESARNCNSVEHHQSNVSVRTKKV